MQSDIYRQITDRIIQQIERGDAPPWRRPWSDQVPAIPRSIVSKRPYQGINCLILWDAAAEHGYSHRWATYRQWQLLGHQVRRGEQGTRIYHWRDCDQQKVVREHVVFAAEQCIDEQGHLVLPPPQQRPFINYQPAERVIAATQCDMHFGGNKAYYSVEHDIVVLPFKQRFESPEGYACVCLHELAHWTGHPSRLNRFSKMAPFGSVAYATEELVGEIGSAFLAGAIGIPNIAPESQCAGYLASWLAVLKADSRAIVNAATQASKAADYILSFAAPRRPKDSMAVQATEV